MIHIGMATGRKWYSIERKGHRDGYLLKDVDGELCEDQFRRAGGEKGEQKTEERETVGGEDGDAQGVLRKQDAKEEQEEEKKEKWIWEGLPPEIETSIDVDDVWKRWRISLPVRPPLFPQLFSFPPFSFPFLY